MFTDTDLEGQYNPMTEAREHHVQFHKTAQEAIAQKMKDRERGVPPASARNRARRALILDHFREIADGPDGRAKVFSLPAPPVLQCPKCKISFKA